MNQKGIVYLYILLGALILVLVSGVAFYFATKNNQPTIQSQPVTSQVIPNPSSDQIANWKTYTNSQYAYSVGYPSDWKVVVNFPSPNVTSPINYSQISINNINIGVWKPNTLSKNGAEKTMLGSQPAFRSTSESPKGIFHDIVTSTKGQYDYLIEVVYTSDTKDQSEKIFNQILSSFTFTDQNQTGNTPNVTNSSVVSETYTTPLFTFLLPSGYKVTNDGAIYTVSFQLNSSDSIWIDTSKTNASFNSVVSDLEVPPITVINTIPVNNGIEIEAEGPGYVKIAYWNFAVFHTKSGALVIHDGQSIKSGSDLFHKITSTFTSSQ